MFNLKISENPLSNAAFQFIFCTGIYLILCLFIFICQVVAPSAKSQLDYWLVSNAMVFFYSLFNSLGYFASKRKESHFQSGVAAFVLLALVVSLGSWWFSGVALMEAKSHSWILLVITLSYLVLISIVTLVHRVVKISMKEDNEINKL